MLDDKKVWYAFYLCHRKFRPMTQKNAPRDRTAAEWKSVAKKEKALKITYTMLFLRLSPLPRSAGCGT